MMGATKEPSAGFTAAVAEAAVVGCVAKLVYVPAAVPPCRIKMLPVRAESAVDELYVLLKQISVVSSSPNPPLVTAVMPLSTEPSTVAAVARAPHPVEIRMLGGQRRPVIVGVEILRIEPESHTVATGLRLLPSTGKLKLTAGADW